MCASFSSLPMTLTTPPMRVAAVKQRSRTFDDLDAFRAQRINRFAVVARLRADRAAAHAVLQNQNSVAVKTANNGTRRARTETAFRDAGFVFENFAERCRRSFRDLRRADRIDRLKRIENRLFRAEAVTVTCSLSEEICN